MTTSRKSSSRRAVRAGGKLTKLYRRWRGRHRALSDSLWTITLRTSSFASVLPKRDQTRLRKITNQLLSVKTFEGALGLDVNESMRARIALHAAVPILNIGLDFYADWNSILVYPGDFRVHDEYMDRHGIVHREIMDLCGQSLAQGSIVLSWEAIREEDTRPADHNLVIHECAHKLDVLNGDANGFPPLHPNMSSRAWARDFHAAYLQICSGTETRNTCHIDPYAAEDPAEFFAVLSETFFTVPRLVYEYYPAVYRHLQDFYRLDPYSVMQAR